MKSLLSQLTEVPLEKPCDADWRDMHGDDRVRRCVKCARDVFDVSAMSAREAEVRLLNAGVMTPCIRYVRLPDGSIAHKPSPRELVVPQKRVATAAALSFSLAAATAFAKEGDRQPAQCVAYAQPPAAPPSSPSSSSSGPAVAALAPQAAPVPSPPPVPQALGGAPPPPQQKPRFGTLALKSSTPRTVTIIGITLQAPLVTYSLTPGDFVAEVTEGKITRQVKFKITQDKKTVVDLDAAFRKK